MDNNHWWEVDLRNCLKTPLSLGRGAGGEGKFRFFRRQPHDNPFPSPGPRLPAPPGEGLKTASNYQCTRLLLFPQPVRIRQVGKIRTPTAEAAAPGLFAPFPRILTRVVAEMCVAISEATSVCDICPTACGMSSLDDHQPIMTPCSDSAAQRAEYKSTAERRLWVLLWAPNKRARFWSAPGTPAPVRPFHSAGLAAY